MKKKISISLICALTLLITGCGAQNSLLIPYDNTNTVKTADIQDIIPATKLEPNSTNLAIIDDDGDFLDTTESETEAKPKSKGPDSEEEAEEYAYYSDEKELTDNPLLLVDVTDEKVVYYNDAFCEVPPASLTKLMTAILVYENCNLDDEVTMTPEMFSNLSPEAQTCGLNTGDVITVSNLIHAMLVYSGNETANALAVHTAGSISDFVNMMNERAKNLGAVNTHFVNTNGLDVDNHYSSVYDLYLMFQELLKYDDFINAIETTVVTIDYTTAAGDPVSSSFTNTNYYINGNAYSPAGIYVYGGKTGTTDRAGACLICYAVNSEGHKFIAVSLGNYDKSWLYKQMNNLLSKVAVVKN